MTNTIDTPARTRVLDAMKRYWILTEANWDVKTTNMQIMLQGLFNIEARIGDQSKIEMTMDLVKQIEAQYA